MTAVDAPALPFLMPLGQRAELLRSGALDPAGYRALLARHIADTEPRVRAFVGYRPEVLLDSPLPVAPSYTVKDNIDVAGQPTGLGIRSGDGALHPDRDAHVVGRVNRLGWAYLGKVAATECSLGLVKPSRNPRYPHVSPAGSSTGSACAVAAGFCDVSIGTDSGGSLRWPAIYCGVTSLRITPRTELLAGVHPVAPSMESVGLVARTVADLRWLWRSYDLGGMVRAAPASPEPRMRVAVSKPPDPLHAEVAALLGDVAAALRDCGHTVAHDPMPRVWADRPAAAALIAREAHDTYATLAARPGVTLGADTRAAIAHGASVDDRRLAQLRERQDAAARYLAGLLGTDYDVIVQPLEPGLPDLVAASVPAGVTLPPLRDDQIGINLTLVASFARLPVLAVTLARSTERSPLGVQVLARPGGENTLLALGGQLETLAHQGWFTRSRFS